MAIAWSMDEKVKKASEYFGSGMYCSQAVLGAFCENYGMDKGAAFRISCGLNSGVRCAEVCGAVSGAVLVIGLRYGDSKDVCNSMTEEFIRIFRERNKDVTCRNILGCDIFTPEGKAKANSEGLFGTVCVKAVADAARILDELGC
ncbi:MAG: C-GCAxxG-C-C family protein [Candidatus Methanoplasma sp.]|jgi:C_GCAxxG_C_C family probable redox protein|nr:C-GCAxxG-C-C family protein [Candidatus Methanoplasma sp.]